MHDSFLDSNVIVYLAGPVPAKAARARALLDEGGFISAQVLNEVANVARRKIKLSWEELHELLALVRSFLVVEAVTADTHDRALRIAERYKLAIFDSAILAAALEAGCDTLWSEDMQDGLVIEGVLTIRNPFASSVN